MMQSEAAAAISRMMRRLPAADRATFTPRQLEALAGALARRYATGAAVDLRRSLGWRKWRWYIVLMIGADRE